MRWLLFAFLSSHLAVFGEPALHDGEFSCQTPQLALKTFLFGAEKYRLQCFDHSTRSKEDLLLTAEHLQKALRSHGVVIDIDDVPANNDYLDPRTKKPIYVLSNRLADIHLTRTNSGWIFSDNVINAIERLHNSTMRLNLNAFYEYVPLWAAVDIFYIDDFSLIHIALVLLLLLVGVIMRFVVIFFIGRQVGRLLSRRGFSDFNQPLKRASCHLGNLAMALVVMFLIPSLEMNIYLTRYLLIAARLSAAISAVMVVYRSVDLLTFFLLRSALAANSRLDDQLVPLFGRGLKIIVLIVGAVFVLQNIDVDVTTLLAGVTIGGLAVSFAAKDTIANLFGSVTIFSDKPFLVGDWIKAADVEGIVETVGFRSTRIRNFHGSLVTVPNSKFTESIVTNVSARQYRRSDAQLLIPFETDPEKIEIFCNGIRAIICAHPHTRKTGYEVHLTEFLDHSLKISAYYFADVKTSSQELRCRHEIYLDILRLAGRINLEFSVPTQTIHIDREK